MDYLPKIKKQPNKNKNTEWTHISETNKNHVKKSFLCALAGVAQLFGHCPMNLSRFNSQSGRTHAQVVGHAGSSRLMFRTHIDFLSLSLCLPLSLKINKKIFKILFIHKN